MMKVCDLMVEDVFYVTLPGTRDDVLRILTEKQVSGVPVLKEGKVVGIVTRSDLFDNPEEDQLALLMTRYPITIGPDASIKDAVTLLVEYEIRRLPVVTLDNTLVGIITVEDLVKVVADLDSDESIEPYLTKGVLTVWEETPLPVVGRIMELGRARAACVLDSNERLSGLITDRDLIRAAIIKDSTEHHSGEATGSDMDEWTWEAIRDVHKFYYGVSKIHLPDIPVKDVMVRKLFTSTRDASVSECAKSMVKYDFDQIPIVNENNRLIALLRDRDLLKALI
ncbi:MAG TPA: CBS domain-containing protein [Candidatus Syntrophoarchaeum butanivorans]|uniref:CBS domain-containing protein n=1 Tax=Candidatus Syntropharchaeum butanivorans TaxID=1839936 RepID=A0A1F2P599_9EURY|nr:MAG: inosine-5`-monophosphate dehydrogenase [Candidatus Syntrophoarchaeum butanivorans]HEC57352.1 CBS domain-containing protein [Candidatus Syntrophoarchaeum butanivorans]